MVQQPSQLRLILKTHFEAKGGALESRRRNQAYFGVMIEAEGLEMIIELLLRPAGAGEAPSAESMDYAVDLLRCTKRGILKKALEFGVFKPESR